MDIKNAVIGGVVGGAIGAAIWAGLGFFTGYESGWIAWGVGLLTGVGVRTALAGKVGPSSGLVAAAIAFVAVVGGKFAAANFTAHQLRAHIETAKANPADYSRDEAVAFICSELVEKYESQGQLFEWPEGDDPDDAYLPQHYPAPILQEATATWDGMSPAEQLRFTRGMHERVMAQADHLLEGAGESLLVASFSPFDVLWFGLALTTAFKVGSRREDKPAEDATAAASLTAEAPETSGWRWPAGSQQGTEGKSS